jgi:hypothetical protein
VRSATTNFNASFSDTSNHPNHFEQEITSKKELNYTTMLPRISTTTLRTSRLLPLTRLFTTTPLLTNGKRMGSNPQANQPDSINANVRSDTPNTDQQSSASGEEHKSGDEHPAKQPDYQAEPTRKTGIGGSEEVKGGMEGLGERGDKQ